MTWTRTLVLITACTLPGFELPAEPQVPLAPLFPSGPGKGVPRKPPGKKEEKSKPPGEEEGTKKRPVNLGRCLDSCAAGGAVFINFCNDIDKPATRAVCFSKAHESEQQCRGFCSNYFGS